MGVPPMEETRALYDAIIMDTVPELPPPTTRAPLPALSAVVASVAALPFTGRSSELARLRAVAGSGQLAIIEGEPGIGKTRLAEEFIRTSGALVLAGAAHELEHALPYHPIIEALRSLLANPEWPLLRANLNLPAVWLGEIARLLPELAATLPTPLPAARAADEARLWEGTHQFLLSLARQRPLLFFLDDLHWTDESTLAMLGYLVRQRAPVPITYLATTRPPANPSALLTLLRTLTREERLLRLPLTRLTLDDTSILARALLGSHVKDTAKEKSLTEWLMQSSEGNPYILAELVRYTHDHALLGPQGELAPSVWAAPVLPQSVYSLIQGRLAGLSESARRVLDTAVAAGREFDFEVVARAAALSEGAALDALDELRRVALVHPIDGGLRYTFDHSLTMEVAYREVGEPRHRLLHRRVAEALESIHRANLDPIVGHLASHFAEGNTPERASPYAYRAGQLAAGLAAWAEAIAFYEQALLGAQAERRGPILARLGEALLAAGRFDRASEVLAEATQQAEALGDTPTVESTRLMLSRAFIPQARYAEAITVARQVIDSTTIPEHLARAELLWGTVLSLEGSDLDGATEHLNRVVDMCRDWWRCGAATRNWPVSS
ncbi:MAG: AAA family ATPase [Ardenticatenales bacterium]|nr:AAA family ATPase [Ardenticatenales bacterium]